MNTRQMEKGNSLHADILNALLLRKCILSINVFDYLSFKSLSLSFSEQTHPAIAQFSASIFQQYEPREIVMWREAIAHPHIWLHLDHCTDVSLLVECADAGFDSVMFDGSHLPIDANIQASLLAVEAVREVNPAVLVECEIGHIHGVEDGFGEFNTTSSNVSAQEAISFHQSVRPDLLAVGFGNMHGHYKGNEQFDMNLIQTIHKHLPDVPLVLHGGSGMDITIVMDLVRNGHCKLNISTDLKCYWLKALASLLSEDSNYNSPIALLRQSQLLLQVFFTNLQQKYSSCLLS